MSKVDYRHVAMVLSQELEKRGYHCRLDESSPHPKFYIGANGTERFTILSRTASYDQGNLMSMKRRDILRDVLPNLPKPNCTNIVENTEQEKEHPKPIIEPEPHRVYPVRVSIGGKGTLMVVVPKEAIPEAAPLAQIETFPTDDDQPDIIRIGLIFSTQHGIKYSSLPNTEKIVCYHFSRSLVPFKFAHRKPADWDNPTLCGRRIGDSLVCDQALPKEIIKGKTSKVKKKDERSNGDYSLQDGSDLREMVNDWVTWAIKAGHNPELSISESGKLCISVTINVNKEL